MTEIAVGTTGDLLPGWRRTAAVVAVLARREVARQLSQPANLAVQGLQLVFFFLVYAVGIGSMVGSTGGISFVSYVFPGVVAIHLATGASSAGLSFAWDREYGFIRELLIAPAPRWTLPAGKAAGAAALLGGQCALLLLLAPLAGVTLTPWRWLLATGACALAAAAFCLLGLVVAVSVRRAESAQGIIQLAMFPMLFLSGAVFRSDTAPGWLSVGVHINPLTYCVDLLRQALLSGTGSLTPMAPAGVELAVTVLVSLVVALLVQLRLGK